MKELITAISAVQADLAKVGVGKEGTNRDQNYKFRSIDTVYNALAPILGRHGVIITPVIDQAHTETITTRGGKAAHHVRLLVSWHWRCKDSDDVLVATTWGESIDTSDKAHNKALVASYKYMLITSLCIPLEGEHDADSESPEVADFTPDELAEFMSLVEHGPALQFYLLRRRTSPGNWSAFHDNFPDGKKVALKKVARELESDGIAAFNSGLDALRTACDTKNKEEVEACLQDLADDDFHKQAVWKELSVEHKAYVKEITPPQEKEIIK